MYGSANVLLEIVARTTKLSAPKGHSNKNNADESDVSIEGNNNWYATAQAEFLGNTVVCASN